MGALKRQCIEFLLLDFIDYRKPVISVALPKLSMMISPAFLCRTAFLNVFSTFRP
jgi:hypothetical protein